MAHRTGEKVGWIGGWIGAFLWVAIFAVVFLARGHVATGAAGLGIVLAAGALVAAFAPWRHPATPYWKLMLAPYAALAGAVAWALLAYGPAALRAEGVSWWSAVAAVPLLLPFGTAGRRRWSDGDR